MADTILLVEDDRRVRQATALALRDEGYAVIDAEDGDAAMAALRDRAPDLVILDVMLPGRDGLDLCREIRRTSDLPIIFLTAKTSTIDIVVGLESGADDYLTKPFAVHELVARVRALLRRVRATDRSRPLRVGDLEVDAESGMVRRAGEELHLTRTEFHLLACLASRPGKVFTREVLLEQVWGYDYLGDGRLVDVHIRRLRAKVEREPSEPSLIQTVRGFGYKLVPES